MFQHPVCHYTPASCTNYPSHPSCTLVTCVLTARYIATLVTLTYWKYHKNCTLIYTKKLYNISKKKNSPKSWLIYQTRFVSLGTIVFDSVHFSRSQWGHFSPKRLLELANIIGAGGRNMDLVVLLAILVNGAETSLMQISVYSIFHKND